MAIPAISWRAAFAGSCKIDRPKWSEMKIIRSRWSLWRALNEMHSSHWMSSVSYAVGSQGYFRDPCIEIEPLCKSMQLLLISPSTQNTHYGCNSYSCQYISSLIDCSAQASSFPTSNLECKSAAASSAAAVHCCHKKVQAHFKFPSSKFFASSSSHVLLGFVCMLKLILH